MQENIVIGMYTLLEQSEILYQSDPVKYSLCKIIVDNQIENAVNLINKYQSKSLFVESIVNYDELKQLSKAIKFLWNKDAIKETERNHYMRFLFSQNLKYFIDNVEIIMQKDYIPSDQDLLLNRAKTTGLYIFFFFFFY